MEGREGSCRKDGMIGQRCGKEEDEEDYEEKADKSFSDCPTCSSIYLYLYLYLFIHSTKVSNDIHRSVVWCDYCSCRGPSFDLPCSDFDSVHRTESRVQDLRTKKRFDLFLLFVMN